MNGIFGAALLIAGLVMLGARPWGVPAAALGVVLASIFPPAQLDAVSIAAVGVVCAAAPLAAALAGSLFDAVCRPGWRAPAERGSRAFENLLVVLAGGAAFTSPFIVDAVGSVVRFGGAVSGAGLFEVAARVGGAVCFSGGLAALVGVLGVVMIEAPLRWCVGVSRAHPLELSVSGMRPFIIAAVLGGAFQLMAELCRHEFAPLLGMGQP